MPDPPRPPQTPLAPPAWPRASAGDAAPVLTLYNADASSAAAPRPAAPTRAAAPGARPLWSALPPVGAPRPSASAAAASDALDSAHREAAKIRAAARLDAEALRESSRIAAEETRQSAFLEGYAAGLTAAREEVEADLGAQFTARTEALQAGVGAVVEAVFIDREAMWLGMEQEIVTLALEVARKVVKHEIERSGSVVEAVVKDALRRVTERASIRVIVNPDELPIARERRADLLAALDGVQNLEIDSDRRIGRGGCVIETAAGSIDAKIETQFEQVEAAMRR